MYSRIFTPPISTSFFIFGPRGTGKTSWLKTFYKNAPYIDLLNDSHLNKLRARPANLWEFVPRGYKGPIIIDEIQKAPKLLDEIHASMNESRTQYQFILTGSSARKLRSAGTNFLAGRARVCNFYPLIAEEVKNDFDLKRALRFGMLPEALTAKDPQKFLDSYLRVYVDQEVRLEGLVRNVDDFARFLEAASFSQGAVLNISNVAADCGVPRKTVQTYFEILEDLLIAYRLPIFARKAKRELIKHDKFYFFDCGLFQTIRPRGALDSEAEISGAAFETLVLSHLIAIRDLHSLDYEVSYWHTKNHVEIDFIVYGEKHFAAIEVKSSPIAREKDLQALKLFHDDYPSAKLIFVYGGKTEKRGDIHFVNAVDFLFSATKFMTSN